MTLTLQQCFGANATETATTITITKSDLTANGGYTPTATDPPSEILVAILKQYTTVANQTTQAADSSILVTVDLQTIPSFVYLNNTVYQQDMYAVAMNKPASGIGVINPNDYP